MVELYNENVIKTFIRVANNSVDLVLTDPPYKTTKRGNSGGTGGMLKNKDFVNGNGGFINNNVNISDYIYQIERVLKDGGHGYIMCNDKNLLEFLNKITDIGLKIFKTLIWSKNNCITNMYYMSSHEYIIFFRKGKAVKINNCGTKSVLNFNNVRNKTHPSEKPVDLLETLIKNSTKKGGIVLDPFMGSGSTGVACMNTGRDFIGFEIDEKYFNIAKGRING